MFKNIVVEKGLFVIFACASTCDGKKVQFYDELAVLVCGSEDSDIVVALDDFFP